MTTREDVQALQDQADQLPYGPEETSLVRKAIAAADEIGADDLSYSTRMRLISSGTQTGDTEAALTAFTWCLGKHDSDPTKFPYEVDDRDLLWYFKHMAGHFSANPVFTIAQLDQMLQDMETRYREAGVGLSGLWQARFAAAYATGRFAEAGEFRTRRDEVHRDDYSHCEACVRAEDVDYFAAIGKDSKALRLYDEIMDKNLSCGDEPESCESSSLLRLLRANRLEDAKAAHLRSYRMARANSDGFPMFWHHLVFCALTGNEARGLDILERSIHQLPEDPLDVRRRFNALLGYGVLLDSVSRAGHGSLPVRAADSAELAPLLGESNGGFTVETLAAASWSAAKTLAAEFDLRNGNDYYSGRIEAFQTLESEHYDLPVETQGFVNAELPTLSTPTTAAEWLERAFVASGLLEDADQAIDAAERAIALAQDERIKSRAAAILASSLVDANKDVAAFEALKIRSQALLAQGFDYEAALEGRLGVVLYGRATTEHEELLREELSSAQQNESAEAIVSIANSLAILQWGAGRIDDAVATARIAVAAAPDLADKEQAAVIGGLFGSLFAVAGDDSLIPEASRLLDATLAVDTVPASYLTSVLRARAQLHGRQGEFLDGAALADRRADLCLAAGARKQLIDSLGLAAALYSDAGQDDQAAIRAQQTIRHGEMAGLEPLHLAGLRFKLGQYQFWSGEAGLAMENFDAVRQQEEAAEVEPASIAETLLWFGRAARAAESLGVAHQAWTEAIELATGTDKPEVIAAAAIDDASLLLRASGPGAVQVAEIAVEAARASGFPQLIVQSLELQGQARCEAGDATGLADFDEARALAVEHGALWQAANIRDSKGRGLLALDRIDESVAELLSAADEFAETGDQMAAAMAELGAARALVQASRADESFTAFRACLERLAAGAPEHSGVSMEFAELLENSGQRDEAAAVRAQAGF